MPKKKSRVAKTKYGLKIPKGAKKCLTFDETGDELWEIENIIQERVINGKKEYLVKWTNWPYRYCTWEPEDNFLEDMSIILDFVKQKNEGIRRIFNVIGKEEKPERRRPTKKSAIRRTDRSSKSREPEESPDTKIIIERFSAPVNNRMRTDVFVCRDPAEEKKQEDNKKMSKGRGNRRGRVETPREFTEDADSMRNLDEEDSDDDSEVKSQRSDFAVPLMENELEKITQYKVVIEECFTFANNNLSQPGSFKFKVAFYDDDNTLKGYDYFTYEEVKQRKWEEELMKFYTQELLNEIMLNGESITKNIKVI